MIQILALIAGFAFGWVRATRRGGNRADKWQYAAGHAIFFFIIAVAVTIFAGRLIGG